MPSIFWQGLNKTIAKQLWEKGLSSRKIGRIIQTDQRNVSQAATKFGWKRKEAIK